MSPLFFFFFLFRYEALVNELDEMVESGYIIPSAEELQAARKGKRDSKRTSGGSMKSKSKSGKKGNGGTGSLMSGGSSTLDGGNSLESISIAEEDSHLHSPTSRHAKHINNNNTTSSNHHTTSNTADNSPGQSPKSFANPQSNRFLLRMQQEDGDIHQAVLESRAARRGDALSLELTRDISELKQQLAAQQAEHADALMRAQLVKQNLESAQQIVAMELRRVATKVNYRSKSSLIHVCFSLSRLEKHHSLFCEIIILIRIKSWPR